MLAYIAPGPQVSSMAQDFPLRQAHMVVTHTQQEAQLTNPLIIEAILTTNKPIEEEEDKEREKHLQEKNNKPQKPFNANQGYKNLKV